MTSPGNRAPGRPRDEQADSAILRAATELLADHGYGGLSMEAVAARAGVAKSTLYRRWPKKEDLVLDALAMLKGPVPQPPGDSVRGDLLYVLLSMRRGWTNGLHARLMRRLSADGSDQPEHYRDFRARLVEPRRRLILDILARGVDEGLIRRDVDLVWIDQLLVSPIVAAVLTHQPVAGPEHIEFAVDAVLRGVAP